MKTQLDETLLAPELLLRMKAFVLAFATSGLAAAGMQFPHGLKHKWALMYLWERLGQPVSQAELVDFYAANGLGQYDRQLRHQAVHGWKLATGNARTSNLDYCPHFKRDEIGLLSLDVKNNKPKANRTGNISSLAWHEKVKEFELIRGGCGDCGRKCDHYDKGHLDRRMGMVEENIVPLCTVCNNWYQGNDADGYVEEGTLIVRPLLPGSKRYERQRQRAKAKETSKRVA